MVNVIEPLTDIPLNERRFILWDPKDGYMPPRGDDGEFLSDGTLGRIGPDNVYLTAYAGYPGQLLPKDLVFGGRIVGVEYRLSGSKGVYDVYRVK
jgi:hypothetical protein